jgi:hypothetical protein
MAKRQQYEPRHLKVEESAWAEFVADNYGVYARIARQLGVTRAYVQKVAKGTRPNTWISRALDAAYRVYRRSQRAA